MLRAVNLALVAVLLVCGRAGAAEENDEVKRLTRAVEKESSTGFLVLRHSGYIIKTDIDAQFAAEAAVYLRRFHEAFRTFFKPKPKLPATPVVYFFKCRDTYKGYMRARGSESLVNAGGAYAGSSTKSELFLFHNSPGGGFKAFQTETLRHEGAHQLLASVLGTHDIPIWFNEGVATFFESWDVEQPPDWNLKNLEATHTRFGLIRQKFGTPEFVDLRSLVRLTPKTWNPDDFGPKTSLHYAEVQSFMTFLLVSPKGRKFFALIFNAIADGKDVSKMLGAKALDGAQEAWKKDIEERIQRATKPHPVPEPQKKPDTPAIDTTGEKGTTDDRTPKRPD